MGTTTVGKELLDAVDGKQLVILIDAWGFTEDAGEDQYGLGDTVGWREGGMS